MIWATEKSEQPHEKIGFEQKIETGREKKRKENRFTESRERE